MRAGELMAGSRPRVVTVLSSLAHGGAELGVLRLLSATGADFEHRVVALRAGGRLGPQFRAAGLDVVEVDLGGALAWPAHARELARAITGFRPQLITAHMHRPALITTIMQRLVARDVPLVWNIHASLSEQISLPASARLAIGACRLLAGATRRIVYVSQRSADDHHRRGYPRAKTVVLPNGIDLASFRPDDDASTRLRSEWGFSADDVVIGHVARPNWIKDHGLMLAAFEAAAARDGRLRAVFCGPDVASLRVPAHLRSRVRVLGLRNDVAQVMSATDVGCLSSRNESLPTVLLEFMACERPCVSTDVGDAAAIVGEFGRIVPPRDVTALADAIVDLAALSREQRAALGRRARASVIRDFEIGAVATRHAALWRELIAAPAGARPKAQPSGD